MSLTSTNTESLMVANATPLSLIWGDLISSPLWYVFFIGRFVVLLLVSTAFAIWDLIVTLFTIGWTIMTNLIYIVPIIGIFVGLYFMHIHWAEFAHFLKAHLVPVFGVIYNDFIRLIWNDIFLPVINILIYTWNALVQVIGFFIYFALNLIVTVFQLIVELIGQLHLPQLFEQIMEIIIPILKLAISILQLLIQVGSKVINVLIPIAVFMLKIVFQYLKFMAKIWIFIIVTIFKILAPILKAVVAVVRFVIRVFFRKSAFAAVLMRALLSVDRDGFGDKKDGALNGASHVAMWEIYATAMRSYSAQQYEKMFEGFEEIHRGIRGEDVFHSTDGYPLDPGKAVADYSRGLYAKEDLEEHEQHEPQSLTKKEAPRVRAPKPVRKLNELENKELDDARKGFLDEIFKLNKALEEEGTEQPQVNYDYDLPLRDEDENDTLENMDFPTSGIPHRANMTREEYYASIEGTDDDWRIDLTWNMTDDKIFGLNGRKLRRARLHTLHRQKTPQEMHTVRRAATAWRHALEHGYYRAHKRHISSGRMHRAFASGWKGTLHLFHFPQFFQYNFRLLYLFCGPLAVILWPGALEFENDIHL